MNFIPRVIAGLAGVALALSLVPAAQAQAKADPDRARHERIVKFWTKDKVAKAVPRDFVLDPKTGKVTGARQPGRPGGGGSTALGASWNNGGLVLKTTGKVLFSMGGTYYVCSASVVKDTVSDRSIILTAAHCAYDEEAGAFAANWMFIPDYDSSPVSLSTTDNAFCDSTAYGCWTAAALVVHQGYASAGSFNTQATQNDFAFAVVGEGGLATNSSRYLDDLVGGQAISYAKASSGVQTYLFGYPAAGKYTGKDLVYSAGSLGLDKWNSNLTYRVASDMTGGCSGGPWFTPFTASTGAGTLISVNSYGYSGLLAMHGPFFNARTQALFTTAQTATSNTVVG